MSCSDTNYVPNEHEDADKYDSCNIIQNNAISKLSEKFGESKWNPYSVMVLTSSSDTNYIPN